MNTEHDEQEEPSNENEKDRSLEKDDSQNILTLELSASLNKQLAVKARDEGISIEDFARELLSEGITLRAWEIIERKSAMRTQPSQGNNNNSRHNNRGGHRTGHDSKRRNNNKGRGQNTMNLLEDKAAFMEYVRSQERKRR